MELAVLDDSRYSDFSKRATLHDEHDLFLVLDNAIGIDFFIQIVLDLGSSSDFVRIGAGNYSDG